MAPNARRARRWALALSVVAMAVMAPRVPAEGALLEQQSAVSGSSSSPSPDRAQVEAVPTRGVRPLGREAEQLLAEARRLSPTVRRLLAQLEASDLFVYVEFRIPRSIRTGQLALVGAGVGVRYLKIEIFGVDYVKANIPWLAHELQHAAEIASAPEVTDDAGMRRLYERIGRPSRSGQDSFETAGAIKVRNQVLAELASAPSPLTAGRTPR
jgi:hypothetical protein